MQKVDQLFIQKRIVSELLSKTAKGIVSLDEVRNEFRSLYELMGKRFFTILAHELKNSDISPVELSVALLSLIPENGSAENLIQLFTNHKFSKYASDMLSAALEEIGLDEQSLDPGEAWNGVSLTDDNPDKEVISDVIEDIDAAIHNFVELPEEKQLRIIDLLLEEDHRNAAFFLAELETFDLDRNVKRSIQKAIYKFRGRNIPIPDRAAIFEDHTNRFYKAYSSMTRDTGELVLYIAFRNGRDTLNIMVFLLNFNNCGIEEYHLIRAAEYGDLECIVFGKGDWIPDEEDDGFDEPCNEGFDRDFDEYYEDDDEDFEGCYEEGEEVFYIKEYEPGYEDEEEDYGDNPYQIGYIEDIVDDCKEDEAPIPFAEISLEDAISLISTAYRFGKRHSDRQPISYDLYRWLMPEDPGDDRNIPSGIDISRRSRIRELTARLHMNRGLSLIGFVQGLVMSLLRRDYTLIYYFYADHSWLSGFDGEDRLNDYLEESFFKEHLIYTGFTVEKIDTASGMADVGITLYGTIKENKVQRKLKLMINYDSAKFTLINLESSPIFNSVI